MAILDVFKKEEGEEKKVKAPASAKKSEVKKVSPDVAAISSTLAEMIKRPHVTEKAAMVAEKNVYTFEVPDRANKTEIAKAVKVIYNVDPVKVNIVRLPSKTVYRRGKVGVVSGKKKAMVYLKGGQTIEFV